MQTSYVLLIFLIKFTEFFNNVISATVNVKDDKQILIIISYDGFRNEYLQRNVTKNLLEFRDNGVYADYMKNVFPTKTFTNHHSIATGVYPEKHGVLANRLYDAQQGPLNYSQEMFLYDSEILPIWIVNQQFNGTSGCMMWPGTDFKYGNQSCNILEKYNSSIPLKDRVDTVISWLTKSENPPNLIMFYSEQPDKLAHAVGPDSENITNMVAELDLLTKYFQDQLTEYNLINRTNVIHLSDHGMAGVKPPQFINLTDYLEPNSVDFYGTSPVLQIVPRNMDNFTAINDRLKEAAKSNGNFEVYTNDDILQRWHCKNKRRLGPILAVANENYAFQDMWHFGHFYQKKFNINLNDDSIYGVHGYDNEYELMHAYFMAKGPRFSSKTKIEPFSSVDLFTLFAKLLQIDSEQIEERQGKFENVAKLLNDYSDAISWTKILVAVCLGAIVIAIVIIYIVHQYRRRQNYTVSY